MNIINSDSFILLIVDTSFRKAIFRQLANDKQIFTNLWLINFFPCPVIPEVKIFSSPPDHTQPIGAAINLTCEARPRDEDVLLPRRRVKYIQWYDPHGRPVGVKCQNSRLAKKLKCLLILKNLIIENFGNYTCEAENNYAGYCTRKSVEIRPMGKVRSFLTLINLGRVNIYYRSYLFISLSLSKAVLIKYKSGYGNQQ